MDNNDFLAAIEEGKRRLTNANRSREDYWFTGSMVLLEACLVEVWNTAKKDTIPIEWLEQHIKELDTELQSLYSRFCSQGDSKEKNEALLRSVKLRTTLTAYETVLSEWRKENEIS